MLYQYFKIEYNEIQGIFHINKVGAKDSNNYYGICYEVSDETGHEFLDLMHKKYSNLCSNPISLTEMKEEFSNFLLTDII